MSVGVGEVSDLIDDEETGSGVVAQTAAEGGVAVERGEIAEHVAGGGEQHGMAVHECLVSDIFGDQRFANAVGPNQNEVGGVFEEVEGHQPFDGRPITALGPGPVELAQVFEAADVSLTQAPFQASASALLLLPG